MTRQQKVRCPQCGRQSEYTPDNPFRPFCSKRCQMVDLGKWASENYKIPGQEQRDHAKVNENQNENVKPVGSLH